MSKGIIVNDMNCTGCEEIVENAIEDIDGVDGAEADHETGRVRVDVSGNPTPERIVEAVGFAGYDAEIPTSDDESDGNENADDEDADSEE